METDELYEGVTSTSQFIHPNNNVNGGKDEHDDSEPAATNPFASPFVENGKAENPFADTQGGSVFNNNPFQEEAKQIEDQLLGAGEQFKRASPSMFGAFEDSPSAPPAASNSDFMAQQEASWIPSPSQPTNPFVKIDSGFISPANNSTNHSASSEGSAENDRNLEDDEEEEGKEVSKLLSGGAIGDLILNANRETPTPPVEDTGSSLEEILAAAREQPDTLASEEVDDSDSSSVGSGEKAEEADVADVADSSDSESEAEEGFSFVKSTEVEEVQALEKPTEELEIQSQLLEDDSVVKPPTISHLEESIEAVAEKFSEADTEDLVPIEEPKATERFEEPTESEPSLEADTPLTTIQDENGQVPADSTLNALDDPTQVAADSSAPSSLDSQSGPASVIVESQEIPNPDQASFIIKPSDNQDLELLPTPQEPVVEVIPEPEVSQSPILEEEEVLSDSDSDDELINRASLKETVQSPLVPASTIPASTIIPHEEMEAPIEANTVPTWQHVQSSPALIDGDDQEAFVPTENPIQEGTQDIINFSANENNETTVPTEDLLQEGTQDIINFASDKLDDEGPTSVSFEVQDVDDFMLKTPCINNTSNEPEAMQDSSTLISLEQPSNTDAEHVIEPPVTPTKPVFLTESENDGKEESTSDNLMQAETVQVSEQVEDSLPETAASDALESESTTTVIQAEIEEKNEAENIQQQRMTDLETPSAFADSGRVENSSMADTVPVETPVFEEITSKVEEKSHKDTTEVESAQESVVQVVNFESDMSSVQESFDEAEKNENVAADIPEMKYEEKVQTEISEMKHEEKVQTEISEMKFEETVQTEVLEAKYEEKVETEVLEAKYEEKVETEVSEAKYEEKVETEISEMTIDDTKEENEIVHAATAAVADFSEKAAITSEPMVVVSEAVEAMDSANVGTLGQIDSLAAPDINVIPPSPTPLILQAKDEVLTDIKKEAPKEIEKSENEEKMTAEISKKAKDEKKPATQEKMSVTAKKAPTTGAAARTKTPVKAPVATKPSRPASRPTPPLTKGKPSPTKKPTDSNARPTSADKSKIAPTTRPAPTTTKAAAARPRPAVSKPNSAETRRPTPTTGSSRLAATTKVGNAPGTSRSSATSTTRTSSTTRTTTTRATTRPSPASKPTTARPGAPGVAATKKPEEKKPLARPARPVPPASRPPATSRPTSATTNGVSRTTTRPTAARTSTLASRTAKPDAPKVSPATASAKPRPPPTSAARSTLAARSSPKTNAPGTKPTAARSTAAPKPPAPGSMAAKRAAAAAKAAAKEKKVSDIPPKEVSSVAKPEVAEEMMNGSIEGAGADVNGHINGNDMASAVEANGEA